MSRAFSPFRRPDRVRPPPPRRALGGATLAACFAVTGFLLGSGAAFGEGRAGAAEAVLGSSGASPRRIHWQEQFANSSFGWVDPFDHDRQTLARVYSLRSEEGRTFLHARYDGAAKDRPPAMHYGKAFQTGPLPLEQVKSLDFRWRVTRHPAVGSDPWTDCAAGIYVIIKQPTVVSGGKGYKFAWLAKPGKSGTKQHGLLQVPLRTDAAGPEWRSESIDLCARYRRDFGPCEGQHVLYVGVVTDGDNTRSVAEADYTGFELIAL